MAVHWDSARLSNPHPPSVFFESEKALEKGEAQAPLTRSWNPCFIEDEAATLREEGVRDGGRAHPRGQRDTGEEARTRGVSQHQSQASSARPCAPTPASGIPSAVTAESDRAKSRRRAGNVPGF